MASHQVGSGFFDACDMAAKLPYLDQILRHKPRSGFHAVRRGKTGRKSFQCRLSK